MLSWDMGGVARRGVGDVGWQHAQDNKRTPGCFCVCAQPGQIKLEILRFQKRRRTGRFAFAAALLRFKYECEVNSRKGMGEGQDLRGSWVGGFTSCMRVAGRRVLEYET